jgi:peptide-methionine (R)-S-oxide reductase
MLKPEYDTVELKGRLSAEDYQVVAHEDTERAFTGQYWDTKEDGVYTCKVCGTKLFDSSTKYDSHCGWPSYYDAIGDTIETSVDTKMGVPRVEIHCKKCGAHLGHVFEDGPKDKTGLRYCVNSASVDLKTNS